MKLFYYQLPPWRRSKVVLFSAVWVCVSVWSVCYFSRLTRLSCSYHNSRTRVYMMYLVEVWRGVCSVCLSCPHNSFKLLQIPAFCLRPVYSDTTQLNSTSSWVELSCVAIDTLTGSRRSELIGDSCSRCERVDNSTSSWVELSGVAINGPLVVT